MMTMWFGLGAARRRQGRFGCEVLRRSKQLIVIESQRVPEKISGRATYGAI
jgi:hypothetical protein